MNPDTPIYRIFDFFALIDTVRNKRLRFSAASTFSDRNEGLEIIYNSLRAAIESSDGSYNGITNHENLLRNHSTLKGSSFVSSWARKADSIALWSLYSADKCGVQISSTVSKLKTSVEDFANRNSMQSQFNRFGLIDGIPYVFVQNGAIREVAYKNLRALHEDILGSDRREQALSALKMKGIFESFTLKDEAYIHEDEIRGIVTCGLATPAEPKTPFTDSAPWLDGDHVYVDISDDFVESVALILVARATGARLSKGIFATIIYR